MRVLVYGMSSDKLGGIETFLLNMNRFMSDDMVFDYVIEGTETIHQEAIAEKGGKVFFIAPKRKIGKNTGDWVRLLRKNRSTYKVVYFNMFSLAWLVPVILSRLCGYRVIVHAHNNGLHDCGAVLRTMHKMNRFFLKHMKIVRFTNSELSAKFFFSNRPAKLIYNAVDTGRFAFNWEIREKIREELGISKRHVYGFAGRIAFQKNPLFLMDIFSKIQEIDNKAAFIVCGDGGLKASTQERAEKLGVNVRFLGNVKDVHNYYQAMDCFVLPSRFEGLGIVLIEAQAAGLPCVTSAEVVPTDAKVTELLEYISLEKGPRAWADVCYQKVCNMEEDRSMYSIQVQQSSFEIRKEAPRIEDFLRKSSV